MKVVIVIPTYNERENTSKMIEALALEVPKIKNHEVHVLYVDDTSPDKTYEAVRQKTKDYPWLHLLLNKEKKGLGVAYAKGFKYAMEELGADYVMEFDADFQHRPDEIKKLVDKIDEGYEYIIGSRYIPGGSIPHEWGISRKFLSVVGNWVARIGLLLPSVHDLTTGFKLTKTKGVLDKIDLDHLYSNSFAYKVQILGQAIHGGAKWVEVPINFMARTKGESKIIKNEMAETLKVIFLVQIHNPKILRFIKFGTVGFTGFVVNFIFLRVFRGLGLIEVLAWLFSTELAIINNYVFNNIWTFREAQIAGLKNTIVKFVQFNVTSAGALIIQSIFGPLGVGLVGTKYDYLVLAFVVVFLVLPYNYLMYNLVIWKTWKLPAFLRRQD
ncbi:glycosyltransferase [Candidatus Woesebacteria bacterium]|nr:glycosyltransferase [Candidatus Woesebacteria bacterium]